MDYTAPWITAFVLGLVNAISHCLLATNIAAICYISKDITNKKRIFMSGVYYTLGRMCTYTLLAVILICVIQEGTKLEYIQDIMSHYGHILLGPLFLIIGIIILFAEKINLPTIDIGLNKKLEEKAKNSYIGSFLLGLVLSLAFCPTSAFIFFGLLIPMSAGTTAGYILPIIFSIGTGLPVIVAAWILAYSYEKINKYYDKMQLTGKWSRIGLSILFILIGLYFIFFHHHEH